MALAVVLQDTGQVALFATGFKTALAAVVLVVSGFRGLYRPAFAHLRARQDVAQIRRAFTAISKAQIALLMPAGIGLTIMMDDYLPLLYGHEFAPAAPIARILTALLFWETAFNLAIILLSIDERYRRVMTANLVLIAAVPIFLWAAATHGLLAAALVYGTARLGTVLVAYRAARSLYEVVFPWSFTLRVAQASLPMAVSLIALRYLWLASPLQALTLTLLAVLVYGAALRWARVLTGEEIELLQRASFPGRRWLLAWLAPDA